MIQVTTSSPDLDAAIATLVTAINANTAALQAQTQALTALTSVAQEIEEELQPTAQSATLHLSDGKGHLMPVTLQVNGPGASAAPPPAGSPAGVGFEEFDGANGTGNQIAPIGPMTYLSSNPAVASVDGNGNVTAVAVGTAEITATDTGNNLSATDVATVVDVAVSATLNMVANATTKQVATKAAIAAAVARAVKK